MPWSSRRSRIPASSSRPELDLHPPWGDHHFSSRLRNFTGGRHDASRPARIASRCNRRRRSTISVSMRRRVSGSGKRSACSTTNASSIERSRSRPSALATSFNARTSRRIAPGFTPRIAASPSWSRITRFRFSCSRERSSSSSTSSWNRCRTCRQARSNRSITASRSTASKSTDRSRPARSSRPCRTSSMIASSSRWSRVTGKAFAVRAPPRSCERLRDGDDP